MIDFKQPFTTLQDPRILLPVSIVIIFCAVYVWTVVFSPLSGTVSATLIESGVPRAIAFSVHDLSSTYYTFASDPAVSLIAAVPSPTLSKTAFVTRARDGLMRVSIGSPRGDEVTSVLDGTVGVPTWSEDGGSIAVARFGEEGVAPTPESWVVLRAVSHGDSLSVGRGSQPHPSPNQRTFALTSQGVALLSYSDNEPAIVIASPTRVPITTPFAVSQDGSRVAWVAPADQSLQVFENQNGYFIPLLLSTDIQPQSMVFSENGQYLLGTTYTEATSTLHVIHISSGKVSHVGEMGGYLKLHTWLYDK